MSFRFRQAADFEGHTWDKGNGRAALLPVVTLDVDGALTVHRALSPTLTCRATWPLMPVLQQTLLSLPVPLYTRKGGREAGN